MPGFGRLQRRCWIRANGGATSETNDVTPLNTPVYLRLGGLSTNTLGPPNVQTIHPDQLTIALVTIVGTTEEQAALAAESLDCEVIIVWDGGAEELSPMEPYRP